MRSFAVQCYKQWQYRSLVSTMLVRLRDGGAAAEQRSITCVQHLVPCACDVQTERVAAASASETATVGRMLSAAEQRTADLEHELAAMGSELRRAWEEQDSAVARQCGDHIIRTANCAMCDLIDWNLVRVYNVCVRRNASEVEAGELAETLRYAIAACLISVS